MAQNECQLMAKDNFYQSLRNDLSTVYNTMQRLERIAEFINTMDADTLDQMSVPAVDLDEGLRATLVECRTAINEFLAYYKGESNVQTKIFKDVINKLRYI